MSFELIEALCLSVSYVALAIALVLARRANRRRELRAYTDSRPMRTFSRVAV